MNYISVRLEPRCTEYYIDTLPIDYGVPLDCHTRSISF